MMSNEPVAWIDTTYHDRVKWNYEKVKYDEKTFDFSLPDGTPLYITPQIKELSDEEIKEFIEDIIDAMGLSMEFTAVRKSGWDNGIKKFRELSKSE